MDAAAPPPAPHPKISRRTFVVDRGFQLKYVLTLGIAGGVVSALFGGMMYLAHVETLREVAPSAGALSLVQAGNQTLVWLLCGVTVMMAAALALFGLLITHRVAGPVYVMSHYINVLAQGHYPAFRPLRKSDELKAFFDKFQVAIEALRRRELDEVEQLNEAVAKLSPLASSAEARAVIDSLRAISERKRDATGAKAGAPAPQAQAS